MYYVEVCVLSAICANRDELWRLDDGAVFVCDFDAEGWRALTEALTTTHP